MNTYDDDGRIVKSDGHVVVWQHRCSDGVGGCTAISQASLEQILDVAHDVRYSDEFLGNVVRSLLGVGA